MDDDKDVPKTPLITPPAEDSDEDGDNDGPPMVFNFGGPQSNEEVLDQAIEEASSFNSYSQSSQSPNGSPIEPIAFNFGPQAVEAPESNFVASLAGSKKLQMRSGLRELAAAINNKRRAATNREFRGGATAYIDEDESGTYDPKKARRTPPSPSRPAKRVKISHPLDEDRNPKPKKPTKQIGFRYSLVVKLEFKSKEALDYLSSIPAGASGPLTGNVEEEVEVDSDDPEYGGTFKRKRAVKRPRRLGATVDR